MGRRGAVCCRPQPRTLRRHDGRGLVEQRRWTFTCTRRSRQRDAHHWEKVPTLGEELEREHLRLAVASLERSVGRRPLGWYCRFGPSEHTRRLVVEEGGFEYDSDSYADDVPYLLEVDGRPWCVVPYALDTNDMKFWGEPSFGTANDFFTYLKDGFDCLYRRGSQLVEDDVGWATLPHRRQARAVRSSGALH